LYEEVASQTIGAKMYVLINGSGTNGKFENKIK
jgi:hypothetical protein